MIDDPTRPPIKTKQGDAVVPDAEDAPTKDELMPEDPPEDAPATGDPDKKAAVPAPVPAHGEVASREQIREAALAAEEADDEDGGSSGHPTGEADADR